MVTPILYDYLKENECHLEPVYKNGKVVNYKPFVHVDDFEEFRKMINDCYWFDTEVLNCVMSPTVFCVYIDKLLKRVNAGELTLDDVKEKIIAVLDENISKNKDKIISSDTLNGIAKVDEKESLGKCPWCKKDVYESKKTFYCSGFKDMPKCSFSIQKNNKFFESLGKKVTKTYIKQLLKTGEIQIKDITSSKGKTYGIKVKVEKKEIDDKIFVSFKNDGFLNSNKATSKFKNKGKAGYTSKKFSANKSTSEKSKFNISKYF